MMFACFVVALQLNAPRLSLVQRINGTSKHTVSRLHATEPRRSLQPRRRRIIWQPRVLAWLTDKPSRRARAGPYTDMTPPQLYRALGCSNRIYDFNACFVSHEDPRVRLTRTELNATDYELIWETPVGRQRAAYRRSPNAPAELPVKWPVSDEEELKVATWRELHRTWSWDQAAYERLSREWAGLGAPTMYICRTTLQKLIIEDMGMTGTVMAMRRYPAACEAYFEALAVTQERLIAVINASPIQIVNFGDNIHAMFLSPRWFRQYILPVYQRRCGLLHAAGKFVHAHWTGTASPSCRWPAKPAWTASRP